VLHQGHYRIPRFQGIYRRRHAAQFILSYVVCFSLTGYVDVDFWTTLGKVCVLNAFNPTLNLAEFVAASNIEMPA